LDWLLQNANVVSALASAGMLVIWSMYAWLFYQEFRRQRGSQLFIHEAGAENIASTFMLVNLSKEPVHILCSMAAHGDRVVELLDAGQSDGEGPVPRNKQGPLGMGESLPLGSFDKICRDLKLAEGGDEDQDFSQFEIRVAAIHGFREWPVGARRRFRLDHRSSRIWPMQESTEQMRSKQQAAEVRTWIQNCRD
jgi:hypothetical protein